MSELFDRYAVFIVPPLVIASWCLMPYGLALVGGWRRLARRFRAQTPFLGRKWARQTGSLGVFGVYTNTLTIGADSNGLFMVPWLLYSLWHPPLFIPWSEISFERKRFLFMNYLELRLGRSEQVTLTVRAQLGARIEAAAGPGWPTPYYRATSAPPPPIA
jgi:hypothetical protein